MATVLLTLVTDPRRSDEVERHVRTAVAPYVRRMPGFVLGRWTWSADRGWLHVAVDFDRTESAEELVAIAHAQGHDPARSWNFERVTLGEDLATVTPPPGLDLPLPRPPDPSAADPLSSPAS